MQQPIVKISQGASWTDWYEQEETMSVDWQDILNQQINNVWNNPVLGRDDIKYIALRLLQME